MVSWRYITIPLTEPFMQKVSIVRTDASTGTGKIILEYPAKGYTMV